ncbi:MAG: lipopolysaccharide kinase InaA family protein [Desulfosalsimonas sp.]
MMTLQRHLGYQFGSGRGLTRPQMDRLAEYFQMPPQPPRGRLGGRTAVQTAEIKGLGKVVIKAYFRGGLMGRIIEKTYLNIGPCRGRAEFEMLTRIRALGVRAPSPVAFASKGRFLQNTWLITQQIENVRTLSELAMADEKTAEQIIPAVAGQVRRLIENRILHVDLHPGNILVDGCGRVYIIDFDKAVQAGGDAARLRRRYVRRWQRSVIKHELPLFLNPSFRDSLGG